MENEYLKCEGKCEGCMKRCYYDLTIFEHEHLCEYCLVSRYRETMKKHIEKLKKIQKRNEKIMDNNRD